MKLNSNESQNLKPSSRSVSAQLELFGIIAVVLAMTVGCGKKDEAVGTVPTPEPPPAAPVQAQRVLPTPAPQPPAVAPQNTQQRYAPAQARPIQPTMQTPTGSAKPVPAVP